ncbi:hypothetical protein JR316_0009963 [Psilocybe cubensis]|uniref:Uncharacterized protein n=2 Tax=Psilocybe cubensis TaxID=181762 RepID=A0A8H7XRA2_PSICU|nr:hypothetical protein JR316_0009963 [Psilocybe cubensis]KAH9477736.1 hypothetical protein JR316_0009963 [Psilocybe cubensis]
MNAANDVVFELCDEAVTKYGVSRRFPPVPTDDGHTLPWVLNRVAHYFSELNRRNVNSQLAEKVTVEFYKLQELDDDTDELEKVEPNLCKGNIIDFVVEDGSPYGIKLRNKSDHDLYPYVFQFGSDLSIFEDEYFQSSKPGITYKVEPTLKKHDEITLGFGPNNYAEPCSCVLEDSQNTDVTFLKIFLSTTALDLNHIKQETPFETTRALKTCTKPRKDKWDALTIPIIQRRAGTSSTYS